MRESGSTCCPPSFHVPNTHIRLIDLLAIGRVANLPTVWSNVITGYLLAWCSLGFGSSLPASGETLPQEGRALLTLLTGSTCAYLFGTFLNDWKDVAFDRKYRPERAIPSGRWSAGTILTLALLFATVSFTCFLSLGPAPLLAGGALLLCVVIYTVIHKSTPVAIIPMGLCRALLYVLAFLAVSGPESTPRSWPAPEFLGSSLSINPSFIVAFMALGILTYVAGLTLAARFENQPERLRFPKAFLWLLIFFCFITHTWWWIGLEPVLPGPRHILIFALILVPFLLWTIRALFLLRKSIPDFVSRALAGLCLVDLLACGGIAMTVATNLIDCSVYLALIPISCFFLGLLLQRLAPAT